MYNDFASTRIYIYIYVCVCVKSNRSLKVLFGAFWIVIVYLDDASKDTSDTKKCRGACRVGGRVTNENISCIFILFFSLSQ